MRSHPAKYGEGFDAPPTLERSGSEHRRAVTSFPLMVKGKAWFRIKDPPSRVSVPCEGNRKGRKAYCGLVRMWSSPCRRDGEVEKSALRAVTSLIPMVGI